MEIKLCLNQEYRRMAQVYEYKDKLFGAKMNKANTEKTEISDKETKSLNIPIFNNKRRVNMIFCLSSKYFI